MKLELVERGLPTLDDNEVDGIIDCIDTYEADLSIQGRSAEPLFIHNFGVFGASVSSKIEHHCSKQPLSKTARVDHGPRHLATANRIEPISFEASSNGLFGFDAEFMGNREIGFSDFGDVETLPTSDIHALPFPESLSWFDIDGVDATLHNLQDDHYQNEGQLQHQNFAKGVSRQNLHFQGHNGTITRLPSAQSLPELEQFLMYHYTHRAVNLFCVIDNRKSPWKTIHLPRALQSIGQLSVTGSSSNIRDALRNALLSISAFCLANDCKARACEDESVKWRYEATILKDKAIGLLKKAFCHDLGGKTAPKYKEFLATMLSMISINVSHVFHAKIQRLMFRF